jgi:hypothetical protein
MPELQKSDRIRKLERIGQMEQDLVESPELIEEITHTDIPDRLPLMLMLITGIVIVIAVWLFIIFLGIGNETVQTTLGNHFMK